MAQVDRDRQVARRKAAKTITQRQTAEELGLRVRRVKRLVRGFKQCGDEAVEQEAMEMLSRDIDRGFGPTLATEYRRDQHGTTASQETARQWMMERNSVWRPRRSRVRELVQGASSIHDWLDGRRKDEADDRPGAGRYSGVIWAGGRRSGR